MTTARHWIHIAITESRNIDPQRVAAVAAAQGIRPRPATQGIVSRQPIEPIISAHPLQHISGFVPDQFVVA